MRLALPLLVSLVLAGPAGVRAAGPDDATLQQEVKALKEMVHELQQRVNALEGRSPAPPRAAPAATRAAPAASQAAPAAPQAAPVAAARLGASSGYLSPEAALRANWSKVDRNMDQGEITRLLGAPSKKFVLDGRNVWYYYYPGTGRGSVFFTDAGRVSSSKSPFGWGW